MQKYLEFREGLLDNRSSRANIIKLEDLSKAINPLKDSYRSLFCYDESILKHVVDTKSVSGFHGKVGLDILIWDLDNQDLEIARKDTLGLINKLQEYNIKENEIAIYYSGRKGFAVEIRTDGIEGLGGIINENIPFITKRLATEIAKDIDSFDRVIYNVNRLYRIAGTLHQKESDIDGKPVKLYKTQLTLNQLQNSSISDIQKYCIELQPMMPIDSVSNTSKINALVANIITNLDKISRELPVVRVGQVDGLPDENLAPKGYKTCLWRLAQGTITDSRDNALLRIADHERKLGFPPEVIKGKLMGVLELMNKNNPDKAKLDPIVETDIDRIIRQSLNNKYDFGCNDEILAKVCSRKCYLAPAVFDDEVSSVGTPLDAYERYKGFTRGYYSNRIYTGIKSIDEAAPIMVGTVNILVGKPGSGKSSLLLNILKHANEINIPSMIFSVDMSEEMLIQKIASILLRNVDGTPKYGTREIMELHARNNIKVKEECETAFMNFSKNVLLSSKSALDLDEVEKEIKRQEDTLGKKIKLVMIDYIQQIKSPYESGSPAAGSFISSRLREMAKNLGVCFFVLSQTGRANGGEGDQPLGMSSAKGSGAYEECGHNIFTCWRPFSVTNPKYDFVMTLRLAKNRLGECKNLDLFWDGKSGIVRDLESGEEILLAGLRSEEDE